MIGNVKELRAERHPKSNWLENKLQRDGHGLTRAPTWLDICDLCDGVCLSTSSQLSSSDQGTDIYSLITELEFLKSLCELGTEEE